MTLPYVHSFARQILAQQHCKIYCNGAEILPWDGPPLYSIPEINIRVPIGTTEFQPSEKIIRITNHQKLMDLGFKIVAEPFKGWFKGQKHKYLIVRESSLRTPLKEIPPEHIVEYDTENRAVRIRGRNAEWNGVGNWVLSTPISASKRQNEDFVKEYLEDVNRIRGITHTRYLEIPKDKIPVMIDENGWIVCIEEQNNEPCIGIVGERRMGNSWLMHAILDRAFWRWRKRIVVMNDGLEETDTWCMPWKEHPAQPNQFIRELARLNEPTLPLPCVYLTPFYSRVTEEDLKVYYPREVGFKISLPYRDMMLDWENFTKGNERWSYKNSLLHMRQLIYNDDETLNERFVGARSFKEIESVMKEKWYTDQGEPDKKYEMIFSKVHITMRDVWNWQIWDISNKVPAKWEVELPNGNKMELDPIVACLLCGLVPVLVTKKIRDRSWFPQDFKYRLNQIFNAQADNKLFKDANLQIWIAIDEILSIAATDNKTVASDTIELVVRESGNKRIGMIFRAQNFSKVIKDLNKSTGYIFAFKQADDDAKAILKKFGMSKKKEYVDEMCSLKKRQVMAFTNHRFVCYDPVTGNSKIVADRPIRGISLPSLSAHKPPKEEWTQEVR